MNYAASSRPTTTLERPERRDKAGNLTHAATWVILDRGREFGTGIDAHDIDGAQRALADHINKQHIEAATLGPRPTTAIPVADVLTLYARDKIATLARPADAIKRLRRLRAFSPVSSFPT